MFSSQTGRVRADRLLSILMLLQRHRKLSAVDLARRLEVSTRTIYRDVEALSAAGVPIYAEQGRNGGVCLVEGYRSDLTGLTADEAQALFLFSGRAPVDALGRGDDLRQAIRKLLAGVPAAHREEVERVSGRFVVDPRRWRRDDDAVPHLAALQEAVLADRRVTIRYPSRRAQVDRDYDIDPYGLVAKAGVWYLLAGTDEGVRTFRVSRVRTVTVGTGTFHRPPGLDVEQLWAQTSRTFTEQVGHCEVEARLEPDEILRLQRLAGTHVWTGPDRPAPDDRDRRHRVVLRFANADHAASVLLAFGRGLEVVDPPEVRDLLVRCATETLARYGAGVSSA